MLCIGALAASFAREFAGEFVQQARREPKLGLCGGCSGRRSQSYRAEDKEHVSLRRADEPRGRRFAHLGDTFL